jgi:hypothetical protein
MNNATGRGHTEGREIKSDRTGARRFFGSWGTGDDYDYATVKYDSAGNQIWVARYDGPAADTDKPVAIGLDGLGNIYV